MNGCFQKKKKKLFTQIGNLIITKNQLAFGKNNRLFWFENFDELSHPPELLHLENRKFQFIFPNALLEFSGQVNPWKFLTLK
jgi:hypothetical protein